MPRRLPPAAIAIAAFFGLVALPRAAIPLIDGDVWWHIRAGNEVLTTGRVPDTDTWSIVSAGAPWTSQDWLSNVALALLDRLGPGGWMLASLLFSALVALGLAILWLALGRRGATGWLGRVLWLAAGLTVAGATIGVRVQVVDLPLAAITLWLLWGYLADRRRRWLAGLPLVAVAWANLHAGWVLVLLLGGAVVVGEALDRVARRNVRPAPLAWPDLAWLAGSLIVSLAAVSLNPSGPALLAYPIDDALAVGYGDFLAEWQPPDISTLPGQLWAAFLTLGVLPALIVGWQRMRVADLLVLLGLVIMASTAARFLLVAPLIAATCSLALDPPLAGTAIGRTLAPLLGRLARPARTSGLGAVNLALAALVVVIGLVVAVARVSPQAQQASIGMHMPVAAVDWMLANDVGERPFNTYSWGGYLGYRRSDLPVYIDGRSDVHGYAAIDSYARTVLLLDDPARLLDAQRIDHVLFNTGTPLAGWLNAQPDWERAYRDDLASVWVRR